MLSNNNTNIKEIVKSILEENPEFNVHSKKTLNIVATLQYLIQKEKNPNIIKGYISGISERKLPDDCEDYLITMANIQHGKYSKNINYGNIKISPINFYGDSESLSNYL